MIISYIIIVNELGEAKLVKLRNWHHKTLPKANSEVLRFLPGLLKWFYQKVCVCTYLSTYLSMYLCLSVRTHVSETLK